MAAPDHKMFQGDTAALGFTIKDEDGVVVDLTGATISWQMARSVHAAAILTKAIGSGITVTDAAAGTYTVMLDPADTDNLTGSFYFETEIIDASGNVSTPRSGTIQINPALIRPE